MSATRLAFALKPAFKVLGRNSALQPLFPLQYRTFQYARGLRLPFYFPCSGASTSVLQTVSCSTITKHSGSENAFSKPESLPSPIGVIGAGGKMATALITGLLASPQRPRILASSSTIEEMDHLSIAPEDKFNDNNEVAANAKVILLSVKPHIAPTVLRLIAPTLRKRRKENHEMPVLISVVAGVSTKSIDRSLNTDERGRRTDDVLKVPIVRTMPNIPAAVAAGCTAVCGGSETTAEAIAVGEKILRCVGHVEKVPEKLFDAFTGVAGCGVAYLFMAAEALADAGVKHGLDRQTALRVAAATIHGAGALLKNGKHPAILRNDVESPGGVTIAATTTLEEEGFRSALICAVDAAVDKVREVESK